jgi:hypothetical protein
MKVLAERGSVIKAKYVGKSSRTATSARRTLSGG